MLVFFLLLQIAIPLHKLLLKGSSLTTDNRSHYRFTVEIFKAYSDAAKKKVRTISLVLYHQAFPGTAKPEEEPATSAAKKLYC